MCVLTTFFGETPQSAKFEVRGRPRVPVVKGAEVLIRGMDGRTLTYGEIAAVLPIGTLVALHLTDVKGGDLALPAEVWLPERDGDPGPPAPAYTRNWPAGADQPARVVTSCVRCRNESVIAVDDKPQQCPHCLAYLVVEGDQTREMNPNQLLPMPELVLPLSALGSEVRWPPECAGCGGAADRTHTVSTHSTVHYGMTSGPLDALFRGSPLTRSWTPSWYEAARSVGTGGSGGGPASDGWAYPLCGMDNRDHADPVAVWSDDRTLGFRSYGYYRAFRDANGVPASAG